MRCQPANEVQVSVSAPPDTTVSVDDAQWQTGSFTQAVRPEREVRASTIRARHGDATVSTYVIRCLRSDFPAFTATRAGNTQAQWYVVTPGARGSPPPEISRNYVAFFDRNGVPMWWMRADAGITLAHSMPSYSRTAVPPGSR